MSALMSKPQQRIALRISDNKKTLENQGFLSAADRNRTGTGITTHGILSPGRLPVPPLRQNDPEETRTLDLRRDRAAL